MTPGELGAYITVGGAALGLAIKGGEWLFKQQAVARSERRASLEQVIERQDEDIARLRAELKAERTECEARIDALEARVIAAERARAEMEGLLYRMGWDRGESGWTRRN